MRAFPLNALLGGLLIGIAVALMLVLNGRVTGVSGILSASLDRPSRENFWRYAFLAGLLAGGVILRFALPYSLVNTSNREWLPICLGGVLVGAGTVIGGGCTSGHGVCGMSRLSRRSIFATVLFMLAGFLVARLMCVL